MGSKIINLTKKTFFRNVFILVTGTAAAQVISLILNPFITRIYGPEAFGLMGLFAAISQIIVPLASLNYPNAIVLPKSDKEAVKIAMLSTYVVLCVTVLSVLTLMFFHKFIVDIFSLQVIENYLYLIPLMILLIGFTQITEQWIIRTKQFFIISKAEFLRSLIFNGGKLGVGFYFPFGFVLIIFTAIREGIKLLLMSMELRKLKLNISFFSSKTNSLKYIIKKYKDFPMYRTPQSLIERVSQNIPIVLLTGFFGPASAGFYTIVRSVLSMPITLIGKSVGNVFYPRIAEAYNKDENLTLLIKKTTFILFALGILPFGIIILFGPYLFGLVFGSDWVTAGEYARWVSFWMFFMFITRPSIKALQVLSALNMHLVFSVISMVTRIFSFIIGYYIFSNDIIAIALFSISSAILEIVLIIITICISKKSDWRKNLS